MTTLTDFLLARIAEDEAPTWRLLDWETPADWPAGYVGRECLICRETSFGGTADEMTEISHEHDEAIHRRSRALAECEAKRRIVELHPIYRGTRIQPVSTNGVDFGCEACHALDRLHNDSLIEALGECDTLLALALPYADHPDYRDEWKV